MPRIREITRQDHSQALRFLSESADLYPDIDAWWSDKVVPDLESGKRLGFVIDDGETIGGLLIARRGERAKLCSLRIKESLRDLGWGTKLFCEAMRTVLKGATKEVYVTISEALQERYVRFFEGLGFSRTGVVEDKYVKGVAEMVYACPSKSLLQFLGHYQRDLFGGAVDHGSSSHEAAPACSSRPPPSMIMSLKPRFARKIIQGAKLVEFRRRFSRKHIGAHVLFYTTAPVRSFQFTARIANVEHSDTARLWATHKDKGGVDKHTFDEYFQGRVSGYALQLADIRPLAEPIELVKVPDSLPEVSVPQSYKLLKHTPALLDFCADRGIL